MAALDHDAAETLLHGLSPEDAARLGRRVTEDQDGDADTAAASAWLMGARAFRNALHGRRICRVCGCWQAEACAGGCWWVGEDLCSSCLKG